MSIATVKSFLDVTAKHGLSRSPQFRLLGFLGVPAYVQKEFNEPRDGGDGGIVYLKSGDIPSREIEPVDVKYMGFKVPFPGQAKYTNSAEFKFRMPEDFLWRNALEQWSFQTYNELTSNGDYNIPCESSQLDVGVLGSNKGIVRIYRYFNVWPQSVGSVSYDVSDDPKEVEFDVKFAYSRWLPVEVTDNGVGNITDEQKIIFERYRAEIEANKANCSVI